MTPSLHDERHQDQNNNSLFPCENPIHSHLRSSAMRQNTFIGWGGNMAVSSQQLAEAGLFHTGSGDDTKCFYCNGGLRDWNYNDDPMEEHARWFPQCEYVLQKRGCEYVSSTCAKYPHMQRPALPPGYALTTENLTIIANTAALRPGASNVVDTEDSENTLRNKVDEAMTHHLTTALKGFGYSDDLLKKVLQRQIRLYDMFDTVSQFLDAVQDMERQETASRANTSLGSEISAPERSVEIQVKELTDEKRCKICLDSESNCVFNPCGHLCACVDCARQLRTCPICRRRISHTTRIYTA